MDSATRAQSTPAASIHACVGRDIEPASRAESDALPATYVGWHLCELSLHLPAVASQSPVEHIFSTISACRRQGRWKLCIVYGAYRMACASSCKDSSRSSESAPKISGIASMNHLAPTRPLHCKHEVHIHRSTASGLHISMSVCNFCCLKLKTACKRLYSTVLLDLPVSFLLQIADAASYTTDLYVEVYAECVSRLLKKCRKQVDYERGLSWHPSTCRQLSITANIAMTRHLSLVQLCLALVRARIIVLRSSWLPGYTARKPGVLVIVTQGTKCCSGHQLQPPGC